MKDIGGGLPAAGAALPRRDAAPPVRGLFLDRDGTLIEHVPYLSRPEEVVLLPGVREALATSLAHGVKLFLFTNQSGVGRGFFTLEDVDAVNRRMIALLGLGDEPFTAVCIAPEHPDAPAVYRKPSPRFILEMLSRYGIPAEAAWMIGDSPCDWHAGRNAGVRTAAIVSAGEDRKTRDDRTKHSVPSYPALLDWARETLAEAGRHG